jgi:hypothetical protein
MQAAALSEDDHDPRQRMQYTLPFEEALLAPLAPLELNRTGDFDEIDLQLLNLSRAATASITGQPRAAVAPAKPAPLRIPEIKVPHREEERAAEAPRRGRLLQAAMMTAALVAALGLGWIGASNIARLLDARGELTGKAAVDAVVERIISAESSAATDAKNKRSSAAGPGQFLDETWLRMIHVYRPDLAKGRSKDETLDLRREAAIAREMTARFAERNAAILSRRGLPVTAGTVYLAHFAGGAGAVALLSAPADADAALVMANADATGKTKRDQIVKANPFLEKFTVADLRHWADRKMHGPDLRLTELLAANAKK